jgi:outer membrane protein TolC
MLAKLADAKRKLDAEREGARALLVAAQRRVARARERVEHAGDLAKARRGELEAGTALALNVVLAETDLAQAKNEYVDAFVQRALARAKLDFVDGRTEPSRTGGAQ